MNIKYETKFTYIYIVKYIIFGNLDRIKIKFCKQGEK